MKRYWNLRQNRHCTTETAFLSQLNVLNNEAAKRFSIVSGSSIGSHASLHDHRVLTNAFGSRNKLVVKVRFNFCSEKCVVISYKVWMHLLKRGWIRCFMVSWRQEVNARPHRLSWVQTRETFRFNNVKNFAKFLSSKSFHRSGIEFAEYWHTFEELSSNLSRKYEYKRLLITTIDRLVWEKAMWNDSRYSHRVQQILA